MRDRGVCREGTNLILDTIPLLSPGSTRSSLKSESRLDFSSVGSKVENYVSRQFRNEERKLEGNCCRRGARQKLPARIQGAFTQGDA